MIWGRDLLTPDTAEHELVHGTFTSEVSCQLIQRGQQQLDVSQHLVSCRLFDFSSVQTVLLILELGSG